ncbi:MAG: hypothetical protein ACE5HE_12240, partial [Phycisphaerae bacterium]
MKPGTETSPAQPVGSANILSATGNTLADAIHALRAVRTSRERLSRARKLVETARRQCAQAVDLPALIDAAQAIFDASIAELGHDNQPSATGALTPGLQTVAHDFIDLARLNTVRRAAYPAETGTVGGEWLAHILRLIDRTDFTVGRMF